MKYEVDRRANYLIFKLKEENLNSIVAPLLKAEFIVFSNEGVRNLIFDVSEVRFADSSGLSAILTAHRLWKDSGAFVIASPQPTVKKLITLSRLDDILYVVPTLIEAEDYVMMAEVERELEGEE